MLSIGSVHHAHAKYIMTDTKQAAAAAAMPELAVVVPVRNEADNLGPLIDEIGAALDTFCDHYEIIYVDDGSTDDSVQRLRRIKAGCPRLRVFSHKRCCGQSAAIMTGVGAARAAVVATLDGDGQNDPADIEALYSALMAAPDPDRLLVAGRRAERRDTWIKRLSSKIANGVRRRLLNDHSADTGCGLKVFSRAAFMAMPHFDHMHRFLPALMIRGGGGIISLAVNHRPRRRGLSNYGTLDRLAVGLVDLFGVFWLLRRASRTEVRELDAEAPRADNQ